MEVISTDAVTQKMTFNGGNAKTGGFFTTFTGIKINPIDPDVESINIKDIARALSNCCRFGGHVRKFYSIAQHSVIVSHLCDPEDAMDALLHDASEAYLGDMVRPLKYSDSMFMFREAEENMEKTIAKKFGLRHPMPPSVKRADDIAVVAEALYLFVPQPQWALDTFEKRPHEFRLTGTWSPDIAQAQFMKRFLELSGYIKEINEENESN
jgi:uncharacterized protein